MPDSLSLARSLSPIGTLNLACYHQQQVAESSISQQGCFFPVSDNSFLNFPVRLPRSFSKALRLLLSLSEYLRRSLTLSSKSFQLLSPVTSKATPTFLGFVMAAPLFQVPKPALVILLWNKLPQNLGLKTIIIISSVCAVRNVEWLSWAVLAWGLLQGLNEDVSRSCSCLKVWSWRIHVWGASLTWNGGLAVGKRP